LPASDRSRPTRHAPASAREIAQGHCPHCGDEKLVEEAFRDILIDRCPRCGGVWLDPGELEKVSKEDSGGVRDLFNFFLFRGGSE
jgi:uncharacterized protein (DUF983 family)